MNWVVQLISTVSLWLQDCLHQFSPWSGKMIFGAVVHICRPMMLPKNDGFEFSWISRRDRVGFSKLFGPAYALLCHSWCYEHWVYCVLLMTSLGRKNGLMARHGHHQEQQQQYNKRARRITQFAKLINSINHSIGPTHR